jgi:hypothetical protein
MKTSFFVEADDNQEGALGINLLKLFQTTLTIKISILPP